MLIAVVGFALMEPVTAATHRFVMHGCGERLHRSHHRPRNAGNGPGNAGNDPSGPGWEPNDLFPVIFASIVLLGLWAGFNLDGLAALVPAGVGVTVYGAAYALVHDGYIHRRVGWFGSRHVDVLDRLASAHRIHHLYNAAPYGMLLPVVPREFRDRAAHTDRDPFTELARGT